MRCALSSVLLVATMVSAVEAQPALSPEGLAALRSATVLVRDQTQERRGTGFVAAVRDGNVFVVTCAHVVKPERGAEPKLSLVFNAGTNSARTTEARISVLHEDSDLALLVCQGCEAPEPLALAEDVELPETTPLFVLGFPFGEALARPRETPVATVSKASVAAIRRDPDGIVERVQLDCELNPGNSGGPVVDADGRVVGVAVAKVLGTNISFCIPNHILRAMLCGRVRKSTVTPASGDPGDVAAFDVDVYLADPLRRVVEIAILTAPRENVEAELGTASEPKAMPNSTEHKLELKDAVARGQIRIPRAKVGERGLAMQFKLIFHDGTTAHTRPSDMPEIENKPAVAAVDATNEDFGVPDGPLEAEISIRLPSTVEDLQVAGGGRYLVLRLRDTPALTVFDTFKGEVVKHIRIPSPGFLYAAGGNTAVVWLRGENLLQSYDLTTFECRKTKANPFGTITSIIMGYSRGGQALVRHTSGENQHSACEVCFLDVTKLARSEAGEKGTPAPPLRISSMPREDVHFRSNSDMSLISLWRTRQSPSGVSLWVRRGTQLEELSLHESAGALLVSDDGRVYSQVGRVFSNRLEEVANIQGTPLFPSLGGVFFLAFRAEGKLTLYESGKTSPLGPIGDFPDWKQPNDRAMGQRAVELPFDRRIIFDAPHGRIAFIPQDNTRVVLRPFDLRGSLDASGVDYLIVVSQPAGRAIVGQEWRYKVEAISKAGDLRYSLDLGPPGMTIDPSGVMKWTPKTASPLESEKVIVGIKDRSGEETYHTFVVQVGTTAEPG